MTGIILAGGENRRMGRDKAFLTIAGRPLIERVLSALDGIVGRIIIVTNSPARYGEYGVTTVTDAFDARGPLTGIYSGMQASDDAYHFIVACDMPFLNRNLISHMTASADGYDVVVPERGGKYEPLHAVYHRRLLTLMESEIRDGRQGVQALFGAVRVRTVADEEIKKFDPECRSFINLNTPEQYKEVSCSDLVHQN